MYALHTNINYRPHQKILLTVLFLCIINSTSWAMEGMVNNVQGYGLIIDIERMNSLVYNYCPSTMPYTVKSNVPWTPNVISNL